MSIWQVDLNGEGTQSNARQGEQLVLVTSHKGCFCGTARKAAWQARKSSDMVAGTEEVYEEEIGEGVEWKQPPPEFLQKCSQ